MNTPLLLLAVLTLAGCVAPSRSVLHGDAFAYVTQQLQTPADTRVFLKGQHAPSELPAAVWIGNVGFGSAYSRVTVSHAREEGRRLNADFVIVYSASSGVVGVIGLSAYRLLPSDLGYVQADGIVQEVTAPESRAAGLQVGDRILHVAGVPFSARVKRVFEIRPGEIVPLTVQRSGAEVALELRALPNLPKHLELDEATSL
jgi:hypothetical protein